MFSGGGGGRLPPSSQAPYRSVANRAPQNRTLLTDILEYSPRERTVSVASFSTIEIEGFGFDNVSEYGDSLYEGSVYDGIEGEVDLSRRAERVLANAKRKLDLCGQNISRARSSLILSPSASPTALWDHLESVSSAPARGEQQQWRLDTLHREQWRANSRSPQPVHTRTASESAVPNHSARRTVTGSYGGLPGVQEEDKVVKRSNSTQQMRVLRDQMKDLRGKITSLQEQTKGDVKRRQSVSSLRSGSTSTSSTPGPYDTPKITSPYDSPSAPHLENIRESRVLNIQSPIAEEWRSSIYSNASSQRSSTPRRDAVNSPFSARPEYRSNAFSYEAYLYGDHSSSGNRPSSMSSEGTASTATPVLHRKTSVGSMSSFATARENRSIPASPDEFLSSEPPTPTNAPRNWNSLPPPSRFDDGYHSAPHTPRVDRLTTPSGPTALPPMPANSSWYRDSIDTIKTTSIMDYYGDDSDYGGGVEIEDEEERVMGVMVGRGDKALIEGVIEALGKVCVGIEGAGERGREEYRNRLRNALSILGGDEGEMF